jgi:hypothetical protein
VTAAGTRLQGDSMEEPPVPRKLDEKNRRATKLNPTRSGVRTGNPQLESHEGGEQRDSPRQRAPRRRATRSVKKGERRGS